MKDFFLINLDSNPAEPRFIPLFNTADPDQLASAYNYRIHICQAWSGSTDGIPQSFVNPF